MHGRLRFLNTGSLHVRSGNTLRIVSSVSRTADALANGPKYRLPSFTIFRVTSTRGHGSCTLTFTLT